MRIEITARDSKQFSLAEEKLESIKEYSNYLYKQIQSVKISFIDGKTLIVTLQVPISHVANIVLPKDVDKIDYGSSTFMASSEGVTYIWKKSDDLTNQILTYSFV